MFFKIMKYNTLLKKLMSIDFEKSIFNKITIHPEYFMLHIKNLPFHISFFREQFDNYPDKRYHLFHITHENQNEKCSSYYWVTNKLKIVNVPNDKFKYNQKNFSMYSSTRNFCNDVKIKFIKMSLQKLFLTL